MSAGGKQMVWFIVMLLVFVNVAVLSSAYMANLADQAAETRKTSLYSVELLGQIQYDMLRYRQIEAAHALSISNGRATERATLADLRDEIEKGMNQYAPLVRSSQDQWLADRFADAWRIYLILDAKLAGLSERNDLDNAGSFYTGEMRRVFNDMADQLDRAIKIRTAAARSAENASADLYGTQRSITLAAMLSVLVLAAAAIGRVRSAGGSGRA